MNDAMNSLVAGDEGMVLVSKLDNLINWNRKSSIWFLQELVFILLQPHVWIYGLLTMVNLTPKRVRLTGLRLLYGSKAQIPLDQRLFLEEGQTWMERLLQLWVQI